MFLYAPLTLIDRPLVLLLLSAPPSLAFLVNMVMPAEHCLYYAGIYILIYAE